MPKATFLNLPEPKRRRFVDVSRAEFAQHGFDHASVGRIVRVLGIAKGSVYQYFDDKADLFRYLVEEGGRRKLAWVGEDGRAPEGDIWDGLGAAYRRGLAFTVAEPEWSRLLLRSQEPSLDPGLAAIRRAHRARGHAHLVALLEQGKEQGVVRASVETEAAAWLVHGMLSEGLLAGFLGALGTDLEALVARSEPIGEHEVEAAMAVADEAVEMLRRGLG